MFATYNRIYNQPDTAAMRKIETQAKSKTTLKPKAYYEAKTGTLLIEYIHVRICERSNDNRLEMK